MVACQAAVGNVGIFYLLEGLCIQVELEAEAGGWAEEAAGWAEEEED